MPENIPHSQKDSPNEFMGSSDTYARIERELEELTAVFANLKEARAYMDAQGFREGLPLKVVNRAEVIRENDRFHDRTVALRLAALEDMMDYTIMRGGSREDVLESIASPIKNMARDLLPSSMWSDTESIELVYKNTVKRVMEGVLFADALHDALVERENLARTIPVITGTIDTKSGQVEVDNN